MGRQMGWRGIGVAADCPKGVGRRRAAGCLLAASVLAAAGCGSGGGGDGGPSGPSTPQSAAGPSSGSAGAREAGLRLVSPIPGPEFAVGGACPEVLVTSSDGGTASYVVSDADSMVEQWHPGFSGPASVDAVSTDPVLTAGVSADGGPFLVAALVTDGSGASGGPVLEVTTLDTGTGEPLGPVASLPWERRQEAPVLPPCVTERLPIRTDTGIGGDPLAQSRGVVLDLTTGEQVLDAPLAGAEYASLAVVGDRALATTTAAYEATDSTGQPPVVSVRLGGGEGTSAPLPAGDLVIGGNAFDYDYVGAYQAPVPGVAGGDKQPTAVSRGLDYESYTFPADGGEAFTTTIPTTGTVTDLWDPATTTKLMVATGSSGAAIDLAAIDYGTGEPVDVSGLDVVADGAEVTIHGFYDGRVWVVADGRPLVYDLDGEEVAEAADWVTSPRYAGQGWAVLADLDDVETGVAFPGGFDPALTTQSLAGLE